MRSALSALACAAAAGCGSPHPLDGLDRSGRAEAGGYAFHVNWSVDTAQATRMTPAWRPAFASVAAAAVVATEAATGCAVVPASVRGDVALVHMALDCGRDAGT